jgi:hypothetical protein
MYSDKLYKIFKKQLKKFEKKVENKNLQINDKKE